MRHGDKINNLGRTASHRRALLSNLTAQLIEHKRITTTLAKAKALRVYAEPLINRGKVDSTHNRRMVFSYLQNKEAVTELFTVIGDKIASRPGGYTRIIKLPIRMGDAAEMAMIELVDFNEIYKKDGADAAAKKTRRSRRGTTAAAPAKTEAAATAAPVEATPSDEQAVETTEAAAPEATAPAAEATNETPAAPQEPDAAEGHA
jgi:large subunit ribosomal protein L17